MTAAAHHDFSIGKLQWSGPGSNVPAVGLEPPEIAVSGPSVDLNAASLAMQAHLLAGAVAILAEALKPRLDLGWLTEVYRLVHASRRDRAIDLVLDHLDDLLLEGRFVDADESLSAVDVKRLDPPVMMAFLSATKAAKDRLPYRQRLLGRIERELAERVPERADKLLRSLR